MAENSLSFVRLPGPVHAADIIRRWGSCETLHERGVCSRVRAGGEGRPGPASEEADGGRASPVPMTSTIVSTSPEAIKSPLWSVWSHGPWGTTSARPYDDPGTGGPRTIDRCDPAPRLVLRSPGCALPAQRRRLHRRDRGS